MALRSTEIVQRDKAFVAVAEAGVLLGMVDGALNVVRAITYPENVYEALEKIIQRLAVAGDQSGLKRALDLAETKCTPESAQELSKTARALASVQAGAWEQASSDVERITAQGQRAAILTTLARRLLEAGAVGAIERLVVASHRLRAAADETTDPNEQVAILRCAVEVLALAGKQSEAALLAARALEIARSIAWSVNRSRALREVAYGQVCAQLFDDARATADLIEEPGERASALSRLATALTGMGLRGEAQRLLVEAFGDTHLGGRKAFFRTLRQVTGALAVIEDDRAPRRTAQILEEVDSWWGRVAVASPQTDGRGDKRIRPFRG